MRVINVMLGESATGGLSTCYVATYAAVNVAHLGTRSCIDYRDYDAGPGDACGAQARDAIYSCIGEAHQRCSRPIRQRVW
jgi:hypothetical protein